MQGFYDFLKGRYPRAKVVWVNDNGCCLMFINTVPEPELHGVIQTYFDLHLSDAPTEPLKWVEKSGDHVLTGWVPNVPLKDPVLLWACYVDTEKKRFSIGFQKYRKYDHV